MDKSNIKYKIPNILTIFRIVLTPIIIVFILVNFKPTIYQITNKNVQLGEVNLNFLLAAILFILNCLTDFFDGFLARKWNCVSDFGKFWDPIADKILTHSVLFCFGFLEIVPIWLPIILLARDIIMDGLRMSASKNNIVIPANIYGKIKTFTLMIGTILIFFFHNKDIHSWFYWSIQNILIIAGTILSIISLIIYAISYNKKIKEVKNGK